MNTKKQSMQIPMLVLVTALLVTMTGCAAASSKRVEHPSFSAQYIRTNGYHSEVTYPVIRVIKTKDELTAYYETNKERYSLDSRSGNIPSDSTIGFLDAVDSFDEAFFEKKHLVLVILEESSGSNRHLVKDFVQDEQSTQILIERLVPPIGTTDMAQWHVIIAIDKKDFRDQPIAVKFA